MNATKQQIRSRMQQMLAGLSDAQIASASAGACRHVEGLEEYRRCRVMMLYLPMPGEIDPRPLVSQAWAQGKVVLVPKVIWQSRSMLAVRCDSLTDGLAPGRYGILEPLAGRPWKIEEIDFILTPALAYDRSGSRLGRGAGLYDRFLSQPGLRASVCGFAFDQQVLAEVPTAPNDRPVSLLVTDREVLRFD
ncbi:MAG: 5-formyltetrahydrofolate cyclo-ligase [Phycisphaerae bacterium]|jgi:5-formyltetrahydrofolate cyclo-ligase